MGAWVKPHGVYQTNPIVVLTTPRLASWFVCRASMASCLEVQALRLAAGPVIVAGGAGRGSDGGTGGSTAAGAGAVDAAAMPSQ